MSEKFTFLSNQKENLTLVLNGYQYNKNRTNKSESTLWRCINRTVCTASVTLDKTRKNVLRETPHSCAKEPVSISVKKTKEKLKTAVCQNLEPIQKLCEPALQKLQKENAGDRDLIPTFHSVKTSLYRARKKYLDSKLLTHSDTESVQIPQVLAKDFLICSDGSEEKIFIFATKTAKNIVKKPGSYYADGTFKSAPKPFYQMFVMHLDLESDENITNIVPVVYALLPNKTE